MNAITEKFLSANKANVEALLTVVNTGFASVERLAALNLNTARALMEDSAASSKAAFAVKDIKELIAAQAATAQPTAEKFVAYSRKAYAIATETHGELSKIVEAEVLGLNKSVEAELDKVLKNAPAGSDVAVSSMKSAIAAANSAYGSATKAVKQVSELTEANVFAITDAAVKAVGTAVGKIKKAA